MTSTALPAPFLYVESDVPAGQTLTEWRHARHAEQHTGARRRLRLPTLRPRS